MHMPAAQQAPAAVRRVPPAHQPKPLDEAVTAMIEQAIAEGRHSRTFQTVCDACRQWVGGIFHVRLGGAGRICRACAKKEGVKDA